MNRTALANRDETLDIIEHVNKDHLSEMLDIVKGVFPNKNPYKARLLDMFEEGVLIGLSNKNSTANEELFVPYQINGTQEEKLFHLAYTYIDKERVQDREKRRYFSVLETESLTPNFTRIQLSSDQPLPSNYAGLCFSVHLKTLKKTESKADAAKAKARKSTVLNRWLDKLNALLFKKLPAKFRQKMIKKMRKDIRAYTLRKYWEEQKNGKTAYFATVDVFTHGNSAGSEWAASLQADDVILTTGDHPDKHDHLSEGKALLICDETAYPAVAGILESWQNPQPPYLLTLSQASTEQTYFDEVVLPEGTSRTQFICDQLEQSDLVIQAIEQLSDIELVWGAMEMQSAKRVRHYLRNERGFNGKQNQVKAYWRYGYER